MDAETTADRIGLERPPIISLDLENVNRDLPKDSGMAGFLGYYSMEKGIHKCMVGRATSPTSSAPDPLVGLVALDPPYTWVNS